MKSLLKSAHGPTLIEYLQDRLDYERLNLEDCDPKEFSYKRERIAQIKEILGDLDDIQRDFDRSEEFGNTE